MSGTYRIKAHVKVLGVIDEYDVEIEHKSSDYADHSINEAKEKIHKKADKGYGSLVEVTDVLISEYKRKAY